MTATYQNTTRESEHPLQFEGVGIHSGAPCTATITSAPVNTGLVFVKNGTQIPAVADNVVETALATVLGSNGETISTVEHLLAALFGCGIDNAFIHITGPEVPVIDGSAKAFADAFMERGLTAQNALRKRFVPTAPQFFRDGDRALIVLPAGTFRIKVISDFRAPVGAQYLDIEPTPEVFVQEIASARTFGYLEDVEEMRRRGLAQGGSLDNALVFDSSGPLQPMRWPNEVVRHKALDLIGDLALLGAYPQCEVIAIKSGHRLHCIATSQLRRGLSQNMPSAEVK